MDLFLTEKDFTDRTDKHVHVKGDIYPHNIHKVVSPERAKELIDLGYINPINLVDTATNIDITEVYPKHTGGGYYELSNGEKVKGKEAAEEAEKALKDGE